MSSKHKKSSSPDGEQRYDHELQCKRNKYYMAVAVLMKRFSTDPDYQVGACIVDDFEDTIVSTGFNCMLSGCEEFDEETYYAAYAAYNAITKCKKAGGVKDCTLYSSQEPCNESVKLIIQSRIKKVYYLSDDKHTNPRLIKSAKEMLAAAEIPCDPLKDYQPSDNILIDWNKETLL